MELLTNEEIADKLKWMSKLMDLHDENSFKAKSFSNAAFQVDKLKTEIAEMDDKAILRMLGVGDSILKSIHEIIETGTLEHLETLIEKTPEGVFKMMQIKGLGPKKMRTIWTELQIENMGELLYACKENRLIELKGFGEKTQADIIKSIQFIQQSEHQFFYAEGLMVADLLIENLQNKFPENRFELTGNIRRNEIVLDKIELISDSENENSIIDFFSSMMEISFIEKKETTVQFRYQSRFPVEILFSQKHNFIFNWYNSTANEEHKKLVGNVVEKNYASENELYAAVGLSFIEPELRNGKNEVVLAKANRLPKLIVQQDIKGVIHCHSKYSDGKNKLKELVEHCISKGFEYLCISDHSQSATYADGLKPEKVFEQHREIDLLNKQFFPFKIFKGIESDILYDGNLDYETDVLESFDFVIASVHSVLKMNEETAMRRLLKAIENPFTTILGHPTGRLLLSRPAYPIDHKKIIDACAANEVVIELNASPFRLDMDWQWIWYALEKNVLISINPDAHDLDGIEDIKYGIAAARKGMLIASKCLNNMDVAAIEKYFLKKRK